MKKALPVKQYGDDLRGEFDAHLFKHWQLRVRDENAMLYSIKRACDMGDTSYYKYLLYLSSDEWKVKRRLVLKRDKNLCQGCKQKPAEDIHHLTYEHLFNEPLEDLKALCKGCHSKLHTFSPQS